MIETLQYPTLSNQEQPKRQKSQDYNYPNMGACNHPEFAHYHPMRKLLPITSGARFTYHFSYQSNKKTACTKKLSWPLRLQ